jgi:hypothetical protein
LLFFHRDGDGAVRRKANLLAFDIGNQVEIDEMMVPLVPAFTAVGLGQFNPTIFNSIDGSDVHAIGPDDFHMLFYPGLSHFNLLYGQGQRAREPYVQFEEFPAAFERREYGATSSFGSNNASPLLPRLQQLP